MMMFHEAIGGEGLTNLTNDYQGFLDVSSHSRPVAPCVFGRVAQWANARLLRDGQPLEDPEGKHSTVLPVRASP